MSSEGVSTAAARAGRAAADPGWVNAEDMEFPLGHVPPHQPDGRKLVQKIILRAPAERF
jgi:hypothetical protein